MTEPLLKLKNLTVSFRTGERLVRVVDQLDLEIYPSETFGLVGESGCGKSVTALSIMRLIPAPPGEFTSGQIWWDGRDLLSIPSFELRKLRGNAIGVIFQEPMTSFNPVQKIGHQLAEVLEIHQGLPERDARERIIALLDKVGLSQPRRQYEAYPHELSGGMRQRAMIAMALLCGPKLLIADEPTTALDVTIQAQIIQLLNELQQELGMAILMITHNLGVVAQMADRIGVMYAGKLVELSPAEALFRQPLHPYTAGLLDAVPGFDNRPLTAIPGQIPDLGDLPPGCYFAPRCLRAREICRYQFPDVKMVTPDRQVACWLYFD